MLVQRTSAGIALALVGLASVSSICAEEVPKPGGFDARSGKLRTKALKAGGGTKETEVAVARGLRWLVRVQNADGSWSLQNPKYQIRARRENHTAATAMGLLPLLGSGYTFNRKPTEPANPYTVPIQKGLRYLISKQRQDGYLDGGIYAHAMATMAMCEAYGMSNSMALKQTVEKAVSYLLQAQHKGGGWRYRPGQQGDLSVTSWVIMALKTAEVAGIDVPKPTFDNAIQFVNSVWNQNNGGYGYVQPKSTPTMTACGLLCRLSLQHWRPNNPNVIRAVDNFLLKQVPARQASNCYYRYYAAQVMFHLGGKNWEKWNQSMQKTLLDTQNSNKSRYDYGSWPAKADRFSNTGSQLMVTSFNLLNLEVYYRHVPLSRRLAR